MIGVEALIRWMHPRRTHPSDQFIPIAEESGQIHALGRWVLWEACRRVVEWEDAHGGSANVNISGAQLRQASLVREVAEILEATGLEPGRLTLEITESVLMEVSSSNTERLDALKKLGVQLAVDDFGTGYSSLQYLKRFPFDWLKIAKPFVDGVDGSDAQARIARAIVDLSHSLEIEVIAEGIESKRQATVLGEIGCPTARASTTPAPAGRGDLRLPGRRGGRSLADRPPFAQGLTCSELFHPSADGS